ncbi:hypothetical protein H0H93_010367 [Arthromyces matolae]|nr:hypothetical protein H0H93_010367 [Arthromyces matolae]
MLLSFEEIVKIQKGLNTGQEEWPVTTARQDRLNVIWEPNHLGLWTSPTSKQLRLPLHEPEKGQDTGALIDYARRPYKTRWLQNAYPYLGFWHSHSPYVGPFECLRLTPGQVPLGFVPDPRGRSWHLKLEVATSWDELESKLIALSSGLLKRNMKTDVRYPWADAGLGLPVLLPHNAGYRDLYFTSNDAAGAALRSRNSFQLLFAFVSFVIAVDTVNHPHSKEDPPSWLSFAEKDLRLNIAWLNDIHQSFICDYTPGLRPGIYTYHNNIAYKQFFPAFILANVPLFICWGFRPPEMSVHDVMWRYRPTKREAKAAIDDYCRHLPPAKDPRGSIDFWYNMGATSSVPSSSAAPKTFLATSGRKSPIRDSPLSPLPRSPSPIRESPLSPLPRSPSPIRDSPLSPPPRTPSPPTGTQPATALHLRWHEDERQELMATETGEEREARCRVEMEAEKNRVDTKATEPTVGGALFEIFGVRDSVRRMIVSRANWARVWPSYRPDERYYIIAQDEWHLIASSVSSTSSGEEFPSLNWKASPLEHIKHPRTLEQADSFPQTQQAHTDDLDEEMTHYMISACDAGSIPADSAANKRKRLEEAFSSSKRAGTSGGPDTSTFMPAIRTESVTLADNVNHRAIAFPDVRKMLFNVFALRVPNPYSGELRPVESREGGKEVSTSTVLYRLHLKRASLDESLERCMVDLYAFIQNHLSQPRISSQLWDLPLTLHQKIVTHSYFSYRRVGNNLHIIGVTAKPLLDQWYLLQIMDPRAVVELFRAEVESIAAMIRYLVERGVPFSTPRPLRRKVTSRTENVRTLGYRPQNYKFTMKDFEEYERDKALVLSGSNGRTSLMSGGILWRLATGFVGVKSVSKGPSSHALEIGKLDGVCLVDDVISSAAEDMICGVYRVYTGQPNQTEDKSWFPKANAWAASGFNNGFWTVDNEAWFQGRLRDIANGSGPLNAKEWKKFLTAQRAGVVHDIRGFFARVNDAVLCGDDSYLL